MSEALDKELDEILEAAAAWHTRLDLGTADEAAFELWRNADPRHAAAFARMVGTDSALTRAKDHIPGEVDTEFASERPKVNRRQWLGGAVIGLGAAALSMGGFVAWTTRRAQAETRIGARVNRLLPDGGQLVLNTDSQAAWRFDGRLREIWLERGEIALAMPIEARPWRIHASGHIISGQGGTLNVRMRGQDLEVSLIGGAGVVVATEGDWDGTVIALGAQQSVAVGAGKYAPVKPLNAEEVQAVTAWQSDELLFTGQTLAEIVAEYNRYLTQKIVIRDPALAHLRLGGRFNVHDTAAFLKALDTSFGIQSVVDGPVIALTR